MASQIIINCGAAEIWSSPSIKIDTHMLQFAPSTIFCYVNYFNCKQGKEWNRILKTNEEWELLTMPSITEEWHKNIHKKKSSGKTASHHRQCQGGSHENLKSFKPYSITLFSSVPMHTTGHRCNVDVDEHSYNTSVSRLINNEDTPTLQKLNSKNLISKEIKA